MGDTIPEWAIMTARRITCIEIYHDAIASALAETAGRVERETVERCAEIANEPRVWPSSFSLHMVGKTIATAIRSLPPKHKEPK